MKKIISDLYTIILFYSLVTTHKQSAAWSCMCLLLDQLPQQHPRRSLCVFTVVTFPYSNLTPSAQTRKCSDIFSS